MRKIRQLSQMLDSLPEWAQVLIAVGLVAYSIAAVYGRINLDFGKKAFSKIPREEICSNIVHIVSYTVIAVAGTIGYLVLLIGKYASWAYYSSGLSLIVQDDLFFSIFLATLFPVILEPLQFIKMPVLTGFLKRA